MGCSHSARPSEPNQGHEGSIEVAQSSSTLLQNLAADITYPSTSQEPKVYTSNTVDHLFKQLKVKPILIKYKPSRGVRLQECSVVPGSTFLDCLISQGRFDLDTVQPPMIYSKDLQSQLSGAGDGDNSILCLTCFASSMNRVISKLQRERILSALQLTVGLEHGTCNIHESLQKQIASTDTQLQRTLEISRLIKICGSSDRINKLMKDGINQFHLVSSKVLAQRKEVATAHATLAKCSAKELKLKHRLQSWCARYHLISAGKTGYDTLIERLMAWVALAVCSVPGIVNSDGPMHHAITQASCVLVMVFKEQLTRERTFLVSKGRSLMLEGGNASKVSAILRRTQGEVLNAMDALVAASPSKSFMMGPPTNDLDLTQKVHTTTESKLIQGLTQNGAEHPPLVDMLRKYEDLHIVLQNEEKTLPEQATPNTSSSSLGTPSVYMTWFQATQVFFDLTELSLSGLMRHFVLSVPPDMACFPVDVERTVPWTPTSGASPQLDGTPKNGSSWTPNSCRHSVKLFDMSEGLVGEIVKGLKENRYTRVVALVGAGISVAAGVPDFRSPGGLYDQMRAQGFQHPMSVFTADFLKSNPESFYEVFSKLRTDHLDPTMAHCFLRLLHDKGCLLRCYTQNIDALERKVGLPPEMVVEAHGTMAEARCLECGAPSTPKVLWSEWNEGGGRLPRCTSQGCNGLLRPSVVFFGEQLDPRFRTDSATDLNNADLCLIMGTSLSVEPFASLVQRVPKTVPRLLVNRHVPYAMQRRPWELLSPAVFSKKGTKGRTSRKDASLLGECDDIMAQLMHELNWDSKLAELAEFDCWI